MSKINNNIIVNGTSGRLGKLVVFRTRFGKTYISQMPVFTKPPTAKQLEQRLKFKFAADYAKSAMTDPLVSTVYQSVTPYGLSPYNVAVRDYMHPPVIHKVRKFEKSIEIEASDDTDVVRVSVSVFDEGDQLLENGEAMRISGERWHYIPNNPRPIKQRLNCEVTAFDHAGNTTSMRTTFET